LSITEETVRGVAELANLRLTDQEVPRMARELESILTHIGKMGELDTGNVPAMAQVLYHAGGDTATLRDDIEHTPLTNDEATANAPLSGNGFFKVPKVIER
jgi:aspartyl-tRNA(Asn)/glutamyl-tRNA(Gln) amidotransferase subunit C